MDEQRRRQFAHLATGKRELLAWTANNGIPLVRAQFGVPFVQTDHSADVRLFYDTDANVARLVDISPTVVSEFA